MVAHIAGLGSYLPKKRLTNTDLEKMVDTTDEWIITRTGITERRIAADSETASTMGLLAARAALGKAKIAAKDIDLIIVATITPDYVFPCTAALIQGELGAVKAAAFDLEAACTGSLSGLSIAKAFVESGIYKNILVIASEKLSSLVDYTDRNTCVLFGDGASAAVVTDKGPGLQIRDVTLGADGTQSELLILDGCIKMNGKEVFKHAVRAMSAASRETLKKTGITQDDVSWLVPHQANDRIIDAITKRFHIKNVFKNLNKYGNTSASSIFIALDELLQEHEIADGENLLLTAFGAGLTYGAAVLTKG
jgi:3-oxoacyl-[acyl-carrier-protein] synthase III